MVGIGVLLTAPPGAPAPTTGAIQLASTESALPLSPEQIRAWYWGIAKATASCSG